MKKMKRTHLLLVLAVTIPLLVLQFSCATVEKKQAEEAPVEKADEMPAAAEEAPAEKAVEMPAEAEEAPEAAQLLADTHKTAGNSCKDCHVKPIKEGVASDVCLTCHGNYKELTASKKINPHDAHMTFSSCVDCHHVHKPSETQCLRCHVFELKAP